MVQYPLVMDFRVTLFGLPLLLGTGETEGRMKHVSFRLGGWGRAGDGIVGCPLGPVTGSKYLHPDSCDTLLSVCRFHPRGKQVRLPRGTWSVSILYVLSTHLSTWYKSCGASEYVTSVHCLKFSCETSQGVSLLCPDDVNDLILRPPGRHGLGPPTPCAPPTRPLPSLQLQS